MPINDKHLIAPMPTPPPLSGAGMETYDATFGTRLLQVTASAAPGERYWINEGQWSQWGSRQLSGANTGKQYFFLRKDFTPRTWRLYRFDPSTFTVEYVRDIGQTGHIWGLGAQFDTSLKRPGIIYTMPNGYRRADRLLIEYNCDAAEGSAYTTIRDFGADLGISGTITGVTSSSDFIGDAVSPLTDLTTHFFTKQRLRFKSDTTTLALRGQSRVIKSFTSAQNRYRFDGYTITNASNATPIVITCSEQCSVQTGDTVNISGVTGNMAANGSNWTATYIGPTSFSLQGSSGNGAYTGGGTFDVTFPTTPVSGDTYEVEPAGYNATLQPGGLCTGNVIVGQRYIWAVIAEEAERGADYSHILYCWDRQTSQYSIRYLTNAEIGGGIHQIVADRLNPRVLLTDQGSNKRAVYNLEDDSIFNSSTDTFHRAASLGYWYQISNTIGDFSSRPFSAGADTETPVFTGALIDGKVLWQNDGHMSCNAGYHAPHLFAFASDITVKLNNVVVHSGPVYKQVQFISTVAGGQSPGLTEQFSPFGYHNGVRLIYMGSASSDVAAAGLISGSGQFSYATSTDTVYVRGVNDEDLSVESSQPVYISEARPLLGEISVFNAQSGQVWRICHTHSAKSSINDGNEDPKGSLDPHGEHILFNSTWGRNNRIDVFIAKSSARLLASDNGAVANRQISEATQAVIQRPPVAAF